MRVGRVGGLHHRYGVVVTMCSTHTYVILEISSTAFGEIKEKFEAAGYQHAFGQDDGKLVIDMHGIAVKAEE